MKKTLVNFPFFYKLLLSYIVCTLVPLIIIGVSIYSFTAKDMKKRVYEQTYTNLNSISIQLDDCLKEYEHIIEKLEQDTMLTDVLEQKLPLEEHKADVYRKIYDDIEHHSGVLPLYIFNTDGSILFSTMPFPHTYKVQLENEWGIFRKTKTDKDKLVVYPERVIDSNGSVSVLTLSKGIYNEEGAFIGYIIVNIPRSVMMKIMQPYINQMPLNIRLIDKDEYIMLDTQRSEVEGRFYNTYYLDRELQNKDKLTKEANYLSVSYKNTLANLQIVGEVSIDIFSDITNFLKTMLIVGFCISLSVCFFIALLLARSISDPIDELIYLMGKAEKGDFSVQVDFKRKDEIGTLGRYFNHMVRKLKEFLEQNKKKQKELRKTEIKMLQAQINPHFLYNTLDVIKWSAKLGETEQVATIVTNLSHILRNSIHCEEEFVSVKRNIDFIKSYLAIQQIKYNNSFSVSFDIPDFIEEYKMPRLILQPFIENAIIHGVSSIDYEGKILITGKKVEEDILFTIEDNGVGIENDKLEIIRQVASSKHIGIYNVDKRIKMYYGDDYGVELRSILNKGTTVLIKIAATIQEEVSGGIHA